MNVYSRDLTTGLAFKFIEPQYIEGALRGSFRVAPIRQYGALEDAQSDPLDGAVERVRHDIVLTPGESPENDENKRLLYSMGIADFGNTRFTGPFTIGKATAITHSTGHALCLCDRPTATAFGGKTAIIQIAEARHLAELLTKANPELGTEVLVAPVVYQPVSFDAALDCPAPDPFVKAPRFEPESEIRILWTEPRVPGVVITRPIDLPPDLLTHLLVGRDLPELPIKAPE